MTSNSNLIVASFRLIHSDPMNFTAHFPFPLETDRIILAPRLSYPTQVEVDDELLVYRTAKAELCKSSVNHDLVDNTARSASSA
jgi:hypothetical protein